jgi:hypothetical protein
MNSRTKGEEGRVKWAVLIGILLLSVGCTVIHKEPDRVHSFEVTLTEGANQHTGTPENPLSYISGTSCAESTCPGDEECIGYCAVTNHVACYDKEDCPTGEYCARICAKSIYLDIQAVGLDGEPFPVPGEQQIHLKAVPGMIPATHEYVTITDGVAENVHVYLAQSIGESYIWVEDTGAGHVMEPFGPCNNGIDDDKDGFIDVADPDCFGPDDPTEERASYATGLSPALYFETPRIWHLQYTDQVSTSPLTGQNVYVDKGSMIVTNVVANGFFVTDLNDNMPVLDDLVTPGYYNSFFFYTFNKPEGIRYGDLLCNFSGGVVEYEGNTQMTFPTYFVADKSEGHLHACANRPLDITLEVPEPMDVTSMLTPEDQQSVDYKDQMMANARVLEPFESGLIKIHNVEWSNRFIACDSDENGSFPPGSDDDTCRDECSLDPNCTQLESFFKYSQMSAYALIGKKFYIGIDMLQDNVPLEIPYIGSEDLSSNCPDYVDPITGEVTPNPHKVVIGDTLFTEYLCPYRELDSVTGNLRHIYLCDASPGKIESCSLQMTMLIPRRDDDFDFVN